MAADEPRRVWQGALERIGFDAGRFAATDVRGTILIDETLAIPNHVVALDLLLGWVEDRMSQKDLIAVGHRVVHGGEECDCSLLVTPALEVRLKRLIPLAPLHLPHNLAGIVAVRLRRPDLPQVASFDTAFHHGLPRVARLTGLPRRFEEDGVRRYGFHGLSYEYVIDEVRPAGRRRGYRWADHRCPSRQWRLHGGDQGRPQRRDHDGLSTLAGLPMGTRPGDLDPGVLLHLLIEKQMPAEALQDLLYDASGLLGISGLSRNMADLLARRVAPEAAEAIEFFCHHARRHLAGLTAALGGLDRLVFTGGIGANSPEIRARICDGLGYLGLALDAGRNAGHERVVSSDGSPVLIEAFKTDEELVIARHARDLLGASSTVEKTHAHG